MKYKPDSGVVVVVGAWVVVVGAGVLIVVAVPVNK